jgi:hypothetical protein
MSAAKPNVEAPPPGVYQVPPDVYHSWPYASSSTLRKLIKGTPAHVRWAMDNPPAATTAMDLGSCIHAAVLEPDRVHEVFLVADRCCAITKSTGERCRNDGTVYIGEQWYCGVKGHAPSGESSAGGKIILDVANAEKVRGAAQALTSRPMVAAMLAARKATEMSIVWKDDETGVLCKARCDGLVELGGQMLLLDVKTTSDANPTEFQWSIHNFGYHQQMAWYIAGLAKIGIQVESAIILAMETKGPYLSAQYRIREEALEIGHREMERALGDYATCIRDGVWPGYPDEVVDLTLPDSVMRRM